MTDKTEPLPRLLLSLKQERGEKAEALEEAAKAVECMCVHATNDDFVRGAREFRKGAANVIRSLKEKPHG